MSRATIRAAIAGLYEDYVGQEGRGAAVDVKTKALRAIEAEWAAEDEAERRRGEIVRTLRAELLRAAEGIAGLNAPDYIADRLTGSLAVFALSLDDGTWTEPGRAIEGRVGEPSGSTIPERELTA